MGCLDKAVGHLIDQPEPGSHITDIAWSGKVPDGLDVLVRRLDPLGSDGEPGKVNSFSCKGKLLRREDHPILVSVGQNGADSEE